ncbi:hypothetical protein EDC04DRAFT_2569561 [Pisolithus marmoratus]|nr:hypothetical protein EDC04DRAFT_2569561 [Pisolithus marmoratus]
MDRQKIAGDVYDLAQSQEPISVLVKESLDVIEQSLATYGPERISLSFNGGKDCTVLLHLYTAALARRYPTTQSITAVYIPIPSPFLELEHFIAQAAKSYGLHLFTCVLPSGIPLPIESVTPLETTPGTQQSGYDFPGTRNPLNLPVGEARGGEGMRRALELYKSRFPHIQAILVGTRRTDPHGATLTHRNMCDPGWPSFERINPIINWSYSDVWAFLKKLQVPYCALYDQGYTSLGSTYNTFPNPALRIPSSSDATDYFPSSYGHFRVIAADPNTVCSPECTLPDENQPSDAQISSQQLSSRYKPAYELADGSLERAGRVPGGVFTTVVH